MYERPDGLYELFSHYWWLLFPLGWGISQLFKNWQQHDRAREALAVLKSYAEQGKEPPPEVLKLLDTKSDPDADRRGPRSAWSGVFLFAALCLGFVMFAQWPGGLEFEPRQVALLYFVALIMGGLCIGSLVRALRAERDRNPRP